MHEDWSPVTKNWYGVRSGTRCRQATHHYDATGRIMQSSVFSGSCGSDEWREYYTYDEEGNQMSREEEIRGAGSGFSAPSMPPPGGPQNHGSRKKIFKYDSQGRLTEYFFQWSSGGIDNRIFISYDAENRISEFKSLDSAGKLNSRETYSHEGKNRFPSKSISFNPDGKVYEESTYSEYEMNSHGDWIKRKETIKNSDGVVKIALNYRNIEYYQK
jgi:hypothetical protein